jgi:hypothetical protein
MSCSPAHEAGSYSGLPNLHVSATNGIDYEYRDTGSGNSSGIPLVLLQRFRGNLDTAQRSRRSRLGRPDNEVTGAG